jgi:hypothetical protein
MGAIKIFEDLEMLQIAPAFLPAPLLLPPNPPKGGLRHSY